MSKSEVKNKGEKRTAADGSGASVIRLNPRKLAIGARIRALRILEGWERGMLAEKMGITAWAVEQWEAGKTEPSPENMLWLADHFVASMDFMMCRDQFGNAKKRAQRERDILRREKTILRKLETVGARSS